MDIHHSPRMRRIVHVSDIHFGRADLGLIERLLPSMLALKPDIIIISGDLTQRASRKEFLQARAFIERISASSIPLFIIPGNHDIEPHHRPIPRLLDPYRAYRNHFSAETEPTYNDGEIAIASIDTVRGTTIEHGRVNIKRAAEIANRFAAVPDTLTKIIVTHHPLALPKRSTMRGRLKMKRVATNAGRAVYLLSEGKVDLYLSGHHHRSTTSKTNERHPKKHFSGIAVQAGTVSARSRGEMPSFNVLHLDKPHLSIEVRKWNPEHAIFEPTEKTSYELRNGSWSQI